MRSADSVDVRTARNHCPQEMEKQKLKSLAFLCDASPKGCVDAFRLQHAAVKSENIRYTTELQVWLPVVAANEFASVATPQKLSALLPSTADASEKMKVAKQVADSTTQLLVAGRHTNEHRPKMKLG